VQAADVTEIHTVQPFETQRMFSFLNDPKFGFWGWKMSDNMGFSFWEMRVNSRGSELRLRVLVKKVFAGM